MKILHNARIHTMDSGCPLATAIAIQNGHILSVGDDTLRADAMKKDCQNMNGQIILPGLVDAHIHLQEYTLSRSIINCELETKDEILQQLADRIRLTAAGEWLRGHGWDQNKWGGLWPCAEDLDIVAPDNPVYLTGKSLHVSWVNSAAMKLAGINGGSPDPENGCIQRDTAGNPTGIFFEGAVKLIQDVIPEPEPNALAKNIQEVIPDLWSMGLTGVHDFDKSSCFRALQFLGEHTGLHFRVVKSIPNQQMSEAIALGLHSGFGDDFLRVGSIKFFADGALGPRTGAMLDPYIAEPTNRGILFLDGDQVFELGRQAEENGLCMAVHAIGDRAVHEVLDGISRLRNHEQSHGLPHLRHRIEHVQTIHPMDANRLKKLDVIASMQPGHAPSDMLTADRFLGERTRSSYAWRMLLQSGARLAFGSDAPVEHPNPFHGVHAAVTRRRRDGSPGLEGWIPEQRLTIGEALEGYTIGPAFASGMEDRLGRLSPGYLADLIVLDVDPFSCDPDELHSIQPRATMINGNWVWQS